MEYIYIPAAVFIALHGGEFHGAVGGDVVLVSADFMVGGVMIDYLSRCGHPVNHKGKNKNCLFHGVNYFDCYYLMSLMFH